MSKIFKAIPCLDRMPSESGRYIFNVLDQGDLGLSKYLWNCSYDYDSNSITNDGVLMAAEYWLEEVDVSVPSETIFPISSRNVGNFKVNKTTLENLFDDYSLALKALIANENEFIYLKLENKSLKDSIIWKYPSKGQFPDYEKKCIIEDFKGEYSVKTLANNEYGDYWVGVVKRWKYLVI